MIGAERMSFTLTTPPIICLTTRNREQSQNKSAKAAGLSSFQYEAFTRMHLLERKRQRSRDRYIGLGWLTANRRVRGLTAHPSLSPDGPSMSQCIRTVNALHLDLTDVTSLGLLPIALSKLDTSAKVRLLAVP